MACMWYMLGCLTPFLVAAICLWLDLGPHTQHELLVRNWRLQEASPGWLVIPSSTDNEWRVLISRDAKTKELKSVEFETQKTGRVFRYEVEGEFKVPAAEYVGGDPFESAMAWKDLNADGRFDVRVDVENKRLEFFVEGRWLKGIRPGTVAETEVGQFNFDPNLGQWQPVKPAPPS